MTEPTLPALPLPPGLGARYVDGVNGLRMEYTRTGFQAGLQWYRRGTHPPCVAELQRMRAVCTRLRGVHRVPGAGHRVQPEATLQLPCDFLAETA